MSPPWPCSWQAIRWTRNICSACGIESWDGSDGPRRRWCPSPIDSASIEIRCQGCWKPSNWVQAKCCDEFLCWTFLIDLGVDLDLLRVLREDPVCPPILPLDARLTFFLESIIFYFLLASLALRLDLRPRPAWGLLYGWAELFLFRPVWLDWSSPLSDPKYALFGFR